MVIMRGGLAAEKKNVFGKNEKEEKREQEKSCLKTHLKG